MRERKVNDLAELRRLSITERNKQLAKLAGKHKKTGPIAPPFDRVGDPEAIIIDKHSLSNL